MTDFFQTVAGATLLQDWAYARAKSDPTSLWPGLSVALVSTVAEASIMDDGDFSAVTDWQVFIGAFVLSATFWFINTFLLLWLGTGFFRNPDINVSYLQLLRTISFASAPAIFLPLALIPLDVFSNILAFVLGIWVLIAHMVALRVVFDFESIWESLWLLFGVWAIYFLVMLIPILWYLSSL